MAELSGKTVLCIAHRLSSLRGIDAVIALQNGRIVEQGGFNELLQTGGYFKQLWDAAQRKEQSIQ